MKEVEEILKIVIPIILTLIATQIQKWYIEYKIKKFKLEDHPLFVDLSLKIININSWRFVYNRRAIKDALIIKLKTWKDEGLCLAKQLQNKSYSNIQLENIVLSWATSTIEKYTKEWQNAQIPGRLIQRITTFHQIKVNRFTDEIKEICKNNDMYLFKIQKIIAIFDTLRLLLAETVIDFNELIFQSKYNGDFKGITYMGVPINDEEYKLYFEGINNTL